MRASGSTQVEGLTARASQFALSLASPEIDEGVRHEGVRGLIDTLAVTIAGANSPLRPAVDGYLDRSGPGDVPVLGTRRRTTAEAGALANGGFAHALDFDDVVKVMPGHPSALIIPALISGVYETASVVTGRALLEAYIVGLEVAGRIGQALGMGHYLRGWHSTATVGVFGGVAGLARLKKLDDSTLRHAFGLAAAMSAGLQGNFGSDTKPLQTGLGARAAITAIALAESGATADPSILETRGGFFSAYGDDRSDPSAASVSFGRPFIFAEPGVHLKKYPCCNATHRAIDAVLQLREEHGVRPNDVEDVEVAAPPEGLRLLRFPRPSTETEARFSMEYTVACSLVDGDITLGTFEDEAIVRSDIAAVMAKIRPYEDPDLLDASSSRRAGSIGSRGRVRVRLRLRDGRQLEKVVKHQRGTPESPLSEAELDEKYADCATSVGVDVDASLPALKNVDSAPDVRTVLDALIPDGAAISDAGGTHP